MDRRKEESMEAGEKGGSKGRRTSTGRGTKSNESYHSKTLDDAVEQVRQILYYWALGNGLKINRSNVYHQGEVPSFLHPPSL
jgi:hypothetical protein